MEYLPLSAEARAVLSRELGWGDEFAIDDAFDVMSEPEKRQVEAMDRRTVNVALIEHRLNTLASEMGDGFRRLESKVDSNLEALQARIEANAIRTQDQIDLVSDRALERAEALAKADKHLADTMERRVAALEDAAFQRVTELEKWRVQVEASLRTQAEITDKGIKAKHLWIAAVGVVVAVGGLFMAIAAVIVTIVLSS